MRQMLSHLTFTSSTARTLVWDCWAASGMAELAIDNLTGRPSPGEAYMVQRIHSSILSTLSIGNEVFASGPTIQGLMIGRRQFQ